jgi:hypothetical protein
MESQVEELKSLLDELYEAREDIPTACTSEKDSADYQIRLLKESTDNLNKSLYPFIGKLLIRASFKPVNVTVRPLLNGSLLNNYDYGKDKVHIKKRRKAFKTSACWRGTKTLNDFLQR